jgi:hypothetical protein
MCAWSKSLWEHIQAEQAGNHRQQDKQWQMKQLLCQTAANALQTLI